MGRADAYISSGETDENLAAAIADYKAALEQDETVVDAWLGLADVYIRMGDFDKAEEVLQQALEKTKNHLDIENKLAEFSSETITDSEGRSRKTVWRSSDGTVQSYFIVYYDEENRKKKEEYYFADGTLESCAIITYLEDGYREDRYDADGTLMFSEVYTDLEENGEFYSRVDNYDKNGDLTAYSFYGQEKTQHYDTNGTSQGHEVYEYNDAGQMTKWLRYDAFGQLTDYYVTEYDADGNRVRYAHYDADGTELNHIDYTKSNN